MTDARPSRSTCADIAAPCPSPAARRLEVTTRQRDVNLEPGKRADQEYCVCQVSDCRGRQLSRRKR
jgi:hypothetical protein